ncbi:tumor necrosis factor ligand superfamily member 14-like [Echeneis naucrates]|uniref:Tumor necrosis factor ligand superfamily member 14-like n=1 Tax=Echeneis naucrates TaxID=173247 RepID=A0A665WF78_ECHNA|nr:tumor necrosis factor ligand superfamily member 14-like [Echeneis naucrates]
MAEGAVGTCPQVFVVESHSNGAFLPSQKKQRWEGVGQKIFRMVVGLTVLGLIVQGFLIYHLYKKTEVVTPTKQAGSQEHNSNPSAQTRMEQIQQRPFAHLMGASDPAGENNVVQWIHEGGEAITHKMNYSKGRLLVEKEGYYYLYSKVQLNTAEECNLIQHKVMKDTRAYGKYIELMKSKSLRCRASKSSSPKTSDGDDLWNSFLAGIFHLQTGDQIFVTLESIQKMRPGLTDNFMGAFMIFS